MNVRVRLMASLRNKLPPGTKGGIADVRLSEIGTIEDVLSALGIPANHVHLVMVNGESQPDPRHQLAEGDDVTIFPPVAGG
jgi:molybdopterin converting factor small subunit